MSGIRIAGLFAGTEIQEFDIDPSGRNAVCSVNKGENWELALLDLRRGKLTKFLAQKQSLTHPRYSPSGDRILYQVDFEGDEDHDIVVVGPHRGKHTKLTDGVADNYSPEFSPEGKSVAFISNREKDIDNLYIIGSSGTKMRKLTNEELPVKEFAWSPDGKTIAYQTGVGDEDTVSVVDVAKGKTRLLLGRRNVEFGIAVSYGPPAPWSPDGKSLLFCTNERDPFDVELLNLSTMKRRILIGGSREKYQPQFSPDGTALAYLEVGDPNLLVKIKRGARTAVVSPKEGVSRHVRWSPDSKRLYFINGSAVSQDEVFVAGATPRKLTRLHPKPVPTNQLVKPRPVRYKSFDGREIPALLFTPKERSRRAGIVMPHGGPEAQTLNEWDQLVQMMTDKGFHVIEPNYRGSTGYGREFLHLHDKDLGGGDFMDTVYAGKYLVDSGLVDEDRLGYWGASYSGFTCMLSLTKTPHMWAAGVSIVGFYDWETEIANERGYLKAYDHKKMGDPNENPEFFRERSPIYFLENLRAPLLMTASSHDVRCPPTESRAVVERLRKLGRKVEYHEYPDEGHWPRKRRNLKDLCNRSVRFLDEHIAK